MLLLFVDFTTLTNEVWGNRQRETMGAVGMFSPRELRGGRVKVYGCSPGCLLFSIAISLLLTLAVNGCIYAFN